MGNTRDSFKTIRNIKGIFHSRMSTIKNRNDKDLTESEEFKKKWKEYMEKLYKKVLMTSIISVGLSLT